MFVDFFCRVFERPVSQIAMSRRSLPMQLVLDSSSDDDDDEFFLSSTHMPMNADESDNETKQRGSIKGHRVLQRDRQAGYQRLYQDYFSENPTYVQTA